MKKQITAWTIDEHPNKEAVFEWVRNHWHDLADFDLQDVVDSLKALAEHTGANLDYCVSPVPDRGEFVSLTHVDEERLAELDADECPLTGLWSDYDVIRGAQEGGFEWAVLSLCHAAGEYHYSDEGIEEFLGTNEYLFFEDGSAV